MPEFPAFLLERIHNIDRTLYPVFDGRNRYWNLWRYAHWTQVGLPHDPRRDHCAMSICEKDGSYRQPDRRVIEKLRQMDQWKYRNAAERRAADKTLEHQAREAQKKPFREARAEIRERMTRDLKGTVFA